MTQYASPMARKPKASHPWKQWQPGQFKRPAAPVQGRETLKGLTERNRAR